MSNKPRKTKKNDNEATVALIVGRLGLLGSVLASIFVCVATVVSSRITAESNIELAKSNIEAAKLAIVAEKDTDGDIGTLIYKERAIYEQVKSNVPIRPFPYEAANKLENSVKNERFTIEAAVVNIKGNMWYRLAPDIHPYPESSSGQAYIYSENLTFLEDAAIVKWEWGTTNIQGRQLKKGTQLPLSGVICSTNPITKITAELKKPYGALEEAMSYEAVIDNNVYSYSLERSEFGIIQFEALDVGNDYQFILTVAYLVNGGKEQKEQTINYHFDIVDADIQVPTYDTVDFYACLFQGDGKQHEVRRYPYDDQLKENLLEIYTTKQFVISRVIKNEYGEIWYKLDPDKHPYGHDAYIFSGDVDIVNP